MPACLLAGQVAQKKCIQVVPIKLNIQSPKRKKQCESLKSQERSCVVRELKQAQAFDYSNLKDHIPFEVRLHTVRTI